LADYTRVEVDPNDNCPMSAYQVYRNIGEAFRVKQVRIYEGEPEARLCAVTGWTSLNGGRASEAYAVQIEDSSQGAAFLVYGGDWGIRLAAASEEIEWNVDEPQQWGETHLVLADREDIIPA
jgi:hypothetical protein